ncbi:monofunctional biosynthetic peptidoglycan transglycosylase [Roseospira navarrensis]|uniref:monofunctional biosynthetic peptidoglycan transglycosylase n=1 Tax=Roseospira navarrensis TaxID=140058 RepID=UPI0031B5E653
MPRDPGRRRTSAPKGSGWRGRLRRLVLGAVLVAVLVPAVGLVAFRWLPVPITPLMLVRLAQGEGLDRDWIPLDDMPPALLRSVIASEDARFCQHAGFDWREIRNAWDNWRTEGRLRGASTISMQTARSVFLWPGRDPVRKGLEVLLTVPLEALWPKRRILEVYLNVAEWGPGVYGAGAAARHHFGRPVASLGPAEAARLTAILPAPRSWSAAAPGSHVRQRAGTIQARARSVPLGEANTPCPGS